MLATCLLRPGSLNKMLEGGQKAGLEESMEERREREQSGRKIETQGEKRGRVVSPPSACFSELFVVTGFWALWLKTPGRS